jgi:MerR family transcriptional regulator, light-induced transcriptional regulator
MRAGAGIPDEEMATMSGQTMTIAERIRVGREALAKEITDRQYAAEPDLTARDGDYGRSMCERDVGYHLSYLAEAMGTGQPALFADYISWANTLLTSLNLSTAELARNLKITGEVIGANLTAAERVLLGQYLAAGLKELAGEAGVPSFLADEGHLGGLAHNYLQALLRNERHVASRMILDAADAGVSVRDLYLHVFQATQREVGRLWQTNQITVAQEHYCTAATQLIMSQLYPRIFATERAGKKLVATAVGGELHELGVRMVADFFEMAGWDTYYLGANTPATSIIQTVQSQRPHVLGISATMTFHVSATRQLIDAVRSTCDLTSTRILVGGYPFNVAPELWREVGADGSARDADGAVETAEELIR